jgi:inorganic pyrophosphatase
MADGAMAGLEEILPYLYKRHPWHGVSIGADAPRKVTAFIEIVPTDTVKYELDKATGYLKIDRPQKFSNVYPSLYGLIPQTYCGDETGAFCSERTGRPAIQGDGDPLDICVLCERDLSHGDVLVRAIPIGGLRMIDGNEADDKIVAVLEKDMAYGDLRDIADVPPGIIERLRHYFLTYKQMPGEPARIVRIAEVYDRVEAVEVLRRSLDDYRECFGDPKSRAAQLAHLIGQRR